MEERPSTIASLIHIVAGHEELRREDWHILSILELQSHLSDLSKRNSVAGTTVALISMLACEIYSLDVSPVKV